MIKRLSRKWQPFCRNSSAIKIIVFLSRGCYSVFNDTMYKTADTEGILWQ